MRIGLKYGRRGLETELPEQLDVSVFRTKDMPVAEDPVRQLRERLENPLGSAPLSEIAAGRQNACIVVSDITRPVPNTILLPPIIETLLRAGIPEQRIRLLVATGIHRSPTREELGEFLGKNMPDRFDVVSHNARDSSTIVRIGYSATGTPIELSRTYLESDVKIVTGLVEPHFMAGYSGGRKSIGIGLASVETVKHLHGTKFLEHPGSKNCELANNPLHAELTEIATTAGADFCVNTVIDAERRIGGIFCGDIVQAHDAACGFAERYCTIRVKTPFDIVITTSAGYPLDTTYYQAVKGLVGALDILSPGGGIILASECADSLGSSAFRRVLQRLRRIDDYEAFLRHIAEPDNFVVDQWEVEMLVKALRRATVYLFATGIKERDWPLTFATRVKSVEEGLSLAIARSGEKPRIAVIPEGPYVIPLRYHMGA